MPRALYGLLWACITEVFAGPGPMLPSHILYGAENNETRVSNLDPEIRDTPIQCTNGPRSRSCWSNGFSVATDFDAKWPTTGKTRSYQFTMTNTTCDPDGHGARTCLLFNNQYPGPTIEADWGDMVQITVTNKMQMNGSSTHWHGIRQLNSNTQDGVNGITECPIPPGGSQTYTWQATQFGSSWYHSHFSAQHGDGLAGPIVINGPASSNYDIDLGPVLVTDWYYPTAFQIEAQTNEALQKGGPGPRGDNILINGKNKNKINNRGSYSNFKFTPGKKHLLRLVNTGVDDFIRVSIDNHKMAVVNSDMVPVKPVTVDSVLLGSGQRYTVIVTANQKKGKYWMRASASGACFSSNKGVGLAVVSYDGTSGGDPTTSSTAIDSGCNEPSPMTPWVRNTVGSTELFKSQARNLNVNINEEGTKTNNENIVFWGIDMTAINVQWDVPTLSYVAQGKTNYPENLNLIELPNGGIWTYWIIQEVEGGPANIPHPMHLHGHDFYLLGKGQGTFNIQTDPDNLQYENPPRRDTSILPAGGWMVIAFPTDNPGAWLFHCHIAWHISEGLGVQFLESKNKFPKPSSAYTNQCNAWSKYQKTMTYPKQDSGLRL